MREMKYAAKKVGKIVKAYCLGENTPMEQELIKEGAIKIQSTGTYELFSQEAVNGIGQIANPGDYFKVDTIDGKYYPYPNDRDFFLKNHRHIQGDEYEQIAKPLEIWQSGDEMCEEIRYLLDNQKMTIKEDDPEHYFNAFLWGSDLSAAEDATIVFYSVSRTESGEITDVDFNFVARPQFENDYRLCDKDGNTI